LVGVYLYYLLPNLPIFHPSLVIFAQSSLPITQYFFSQSSVTPFTLPPSRGKEKVEDLSPHQSKGALRLRSTQKGLRIGDKVPLRSGLTALMGPQWKGCGFDPAVL